LSVTPLAGPPDGDAAVIKESWEDPERFAAIFDRYFTEIHRYLARRVGVKVASDLAAEVFLAAFAQRKRYDVARGCARPWLYGIATNMAAAHWRDERRFYRALARTEAEFVSHSEEDRVTDRVSASAARPGGGPAAGARGRPPPPPPPTGMCCCLSPWPTSATRRSRKHSASPTARCARGCTGPGARSGDHWAASTRPATPRSRPVADASGSRPMDEMNHRRSQCHG
jgi:hypothetical protein